MTAFYDRASDVVRRIYARRIDTPPILDAARDFPNGAKFLAAWREIRDEAMAVGPASAPRFHDIMPEQAAISANDDRDWRMFVLKAYGIAVPGNARRMPVLARLVAQCPEVLSAAISFLAPHKHIPRHRGPFRGIMRFHLGLEVPRDAGGRPATVMTIDDRHHRIGDGEGLLWDDTFPHEVLNAADRPRTALLLDVWRPRMPPDMEVLSRLIAGLVRLGMRYRGVTFGG